MFSNDNSRDLSWKGKNEKKFWKLSFILMTIIIVLIVGLKFDGSLSRLLEQRDDFISNIQMGGDRYTFSLASLKYYFSCIAEPFALLNILGNIGPFAILAFLACGAFSNNKVLYSMLYCILLGIGIELFQYITWFGAFDISDILLRFTGILIGLLAYYLIFFKAGRCNQDGKDI